MPDIDRDNLLDDLSAYLDGELSQQRAAEVDRLLAESPDARGLLAELREVREQVRGLPVRRAPAELSAALHGPVVKRAVWPRRVLRLGVPLAAAAAAVLAIGVYLHEQARPRAVTTPAHIAQRTVVAVPRPAAPEPAPPFAAAAPREDQEKRAGPSLEVARQTLEGQGWADVRMRGDEKPPALAIALHADADEIQDRLGPAAQQRPLALAIHPHSDAEHAQYAALLASWSPAQSSVTSGQAVEYVYQLALPDVSAKVAQLLDVQTAGEETEAAPMPAAPAPVGRGMAAKAGEKKDAGAAEKRGAPAGGAGGKAPGQGFPRRSIVGDEREEAARIRWAHAQHEAVTEEPEIIIKDAPGPASAPTSSPAGPATGGESNERQLELIAKGQLPAWVTQVPASSPAGAMQAGVQQVEMRIELAPAGANAQASRPAR